MKKVNKSLLILVFFIRWLSAQVGLGTAIDTNAVYVAGSVQVEYAFPQLPQGQRIQWPDYTTSLKDNQTISFVGAQVDTLLENNRYSYKQKVTFIVWEEGEVQIPSFNFRIADTVLQSEPIQLKVQPIPIEDPQKVADIYPIQTIDLDWKDKAQKWYYQLLDYWWVVLVLLLIPIIYLYLYWRKKRRQARENIPEVILPPAVEAWQLLEKIEQEALHLSQDYKVYYTALSFVVRNFLQRAYHIPAMEETSVQILKQLRKTPFQNSQKELLKELLELADLVKFAKQEPQQAENIAALEKVKRFIQYNLDQHEHEQAQN